MQKRPKHDFPVWLYLHAFEINHDHLPQAQVVSRFRGRRISYSGRFVLQNLRHRQLSACRSSPGRDQIHQGSKCSIRSPPYPIINVHLLHRRHNSMPHPNREIASEWLAVLSLGGMQLQVSHASVPSALLAACPTSGRLLPSRCEPSLCNVFVNVCRRTSMSRISRNLGSELNDTPEYVFRAVGALVSFVDC